MEGKLYLGKWVKKHTVESIDMRIMSHYIGQDPKTLKSWKDDRLTIVAHLPDFWPVIFKFSDEEILKLIGQLSVILRDRLRGKQDQTTAHWKSEGD